MPAARAQTVETILGNGLFEPYGVAIGVGNLYYVTDSANNRVIVVNPLSGGVTNLAGVAGNGGAGAQDGTSEQARFYSPQGIVRTSSALYIADSGNNLIRKIDLNGNVSTIVGDIRYPQLSHANQLPMDNAGTNDGPGILAKVNAPSGLALDKGGTNLFIADTLNGTIRRVALAGNYPVSTLMVKDQGVPVVAHFNRPAAVAVSATGRIFVADSERHAIYELLEGDHIELIAGSGNAQASGTTDSSTAIQALFKSPRGLYVDDIRHEILVSDSGNGLLRRVTNLDQGAMGVQTVPGSKDAGILKPIGISRDTESVIVFADLDANAIKGLRQTTTQPQIAAPIIGYIVNTNINFPNDCQFQVITNVTFFNEQFLTIQSEGGTATYFTYGPTENAANIPDPSPEFSAAPDFADCNSSTRVNLMDRISPRPPRLTIKAMSTAENRRPSTITVGNVTFQAANPSILGADATAVSFVTQTDGAKIYYTFGSNPPDPNPDDPNTGTRLYAGNTLNLYDTRTNVTVKVIAKRENYVTSPVVAKTYLKTDVRRSIVGIPRNFVGGVGSTLVVPMTLDVAPSNVVRTLQYRVEITPKDGAHTNAIPTPSLLRVRPEDFIPINFPGANLASSTPYVLSDASKTVIARGVSIFFLQTNINFIVTNQVTLGALAVQIPRNAVEGDTYNIAVVKPSGTSDGIDTPVTLAPSATATITITNKPYVVGDVGPATWYNVGEFGTLDSQGEPLIENNDVTLAFRASLGLAVPYVFSDIFDAMDAFPLDVEGFAGGDGVIRFLDWQTILRRSLGLDQAMWQRRRDANGDIVVKSISGGLPLNAAEMLLASAPENTAAGTTTTSQVVWSREALLCAGSLDGDGIIQGNTVSVPIGLTVRPGKSISGMQFTATVTAMGNNPPISAVGFQIAPGLPGASLSATGSGMITPAWNLGSFVPSLTGSNLIGYVRFQVPLTAITGQSYLIELAGEGEPDEYTQYNYFETSRGYVTVHAIGPVDDSISDQWRTNFFGSVDAPLSAATADPDGDGVPNIVEFQDGTSPIVNNFRLQVSYSLANGKNTVLLEWFGGSGLKYSVEASDLQANNWLPVAASISGQGGMLQFTNQSTLTPQFYRVRIVP